MDRIISGIIDKVAADNAVSKAVVETIYMDMFAFIKSKIEAVDFDKIQTAEEMELAKTNFNIPRVLKLYTTFDRVDYARRKINEKDSPFSKRGDSYDTAEETS